MKRLFFIPLVSAMIGAGVVVGVLAGLGDLGGKEKIVTEVRRTQPIAPSNASAQSPGLTPHQIYVKDAPGVVYVQSNVVRKAESPFNFFGGEAEEGIASGSGIVISSEGLILTNWHVVENAVRVSVKYSENGNPVEAKVVGKNPSKDLALLKVPASGALHPLKLGDSSKVQVGDPVLAIGNPFDLDRTLTTGVVSALQRAIKAPNGFTITNVIQTDAPINPGNSGGPLLNARGEVIGINSQIETGGASNGNIGIGFAVPINTAKEQLPALKEGGTIRGAYLGVETETVSGEMSGLNLPVKHGALIVKVWPGTPAAKAGLHGGTVRAQTASGIVPLGGDIIVGVNGKAIPNSEVLGTVIGNMKPGEKATLEIVRPSGGGKYEDKKLEVTVGAQPNRVPSGGEVPEG